MENEKQQAGKKKTVMMIVGAVIVLAVIIAIVLSMPKNNEQPGPGGENQTPNQGDVTPGGEGDVTPGEEGMEPVEAEVTNPVLEGAVTQAPGADLITTDGRVVNQEGNEVKTDVAYNSPEAPRQTQALSEEEQQEIVQATKLTLDANGFNPREFRIGAGEALTITLTGSEDSSHVFAFADPALSAVYINVRPGETRAVTFNAPDEPGEYEFFCDFPGHRARGETGVMIVE
jgi:plastocyanin